MKMIIVYILGALCFVTGGCASNRNDAIYGDKYYSEGSIMIQEGVKMKAAEGRWIPVPGSKD